VDDERAPAEIVKASGLTIGNTEKEREMVPQVLLFAALSALAQTPPRGAPELIGGTWRLVQFQGGDDTTLKPDDPSKYTLQFNADGSVVARIDCNRGRATWRSAGANQLRFGLLALTRMMCPPGSLHDHIVRQWAFVRSYVIKDGRLFLSLMADGGTYEFRIEK
jgi:para-nitrobenzyl esterase